MAGAFEVEGREGRSVDIESERVVYEVRRSWVRAGRQVGEGIMRKMVKRIEDWLLRAIQRRCEHPSDMVASDILEGCGDYEITYCNRCGAVSHRLSTPLTPYGREWRLPDPYLWRG